MTFDGKKQRNALTAAENALRALAEGNAARARANASRAADLDQLDVYAELAAAVDEAAGAERPTAEQWDAIAATLEAGPLTFLIDELRG